ncbi:MAG: GntR family transcriptional regulator [Lachnospiraceae bacterium]|nr:GntR family transcriptional regulator [Lachnospiraceae bacterium]
MKEVSFLEWEFKKGVPIYMQIIEKMEMDLLSGKYKPGDKLPSVRDMAMEAGVNPNTMQKAFSEMERSGLIYTERTAGRFVTTDHGRISALKSELSVKYLDELFETLHSLGFTDSEILSAVKEKCEGEE